MALVAGVDSSTQSCKVVVCDAETGAVADERRAGHPGGTEVPAQAWWEALQEAGAGLLHHVEAMAVAGQQHGLVTVDDRGLPVRDALLWNDIRSADAAEALIGEFGGPQAWVDAVGLAPVAATTVAKLRWVADNEPAAADRVAQVMLPHDYLTWRLRGGPDSGARPTTDRSDASGTGYWSAADGYRTNLVDLAFRGRRPELPRVIEPAGIAGHTASGTAVAAGMGDNAGAALGLGIGAGDVVVSLGTSGTAFARSPRPPRDPSGAVQGFADATGQFLPLVCTLNAAQVLDATAALLGVDLAGLEALARQGDPGAGGLVLLPYLGGERTPNYPHASGSLHGLRTDAMTPAHVARAAVEGMLCNLADALDCLRAQDIPVHRILLVGGAARSALVAELAAQIFAAPITVPAPAEYVAIGAARQAAWAVSGSPAPPAWPVPATREVPAPADPAAGDHIRAAYAAARHSLYG